MDSWGAGCDQARFSHLSWERTIFASQYRLIAVPMAKGSGGKANRDIASAILFLFHDRKPCFAFGTVFCFDSSKQFLTRNDFDFEL
jgi:hypothetical protein